jgi:NADH-quinone oxidoreductase subunit A
MIAVIDDYLPVLLLTALALGFAVASILASALLSPRRPTPTKRDAYECGIEPMRLPAGERFDVKFYRVAMLFIIFDIETIFLIAWAVVARPLSLFGLVLIGIFVVLLFLVEAYVWLEGSLDWESPAQRRAALAEVKRRRAAERREREVARAG